MNRAVVVALIVALVPLASLADPPTLAPVDVNVTNPVLPVEIDNADPIPVSAQMQEHLAQYSFSCTALTESTETCTAPLGDTVTLPEGQRFVIKYLSAHMTSDGDSSNPRDFNWDLNLPDGTVWFPTTGSKRRYDGTAEYVGSQNVLLLVDEVGSGGGRPQLQCNANRPNASGEHFYCSFEATGYFAPNP